MSIFTEFHEQYYKSQIYLTSIKYRLQSEAHYIIA